MTRFSYTSTDNQPASLMPYLPLTLINRNQAVEVSGLLDTGAAVNVLPYHVGLALGARWEEQKVPVGLVGSLGQFEARALVVKGIHASINPDKAVHLVFAWTQSQNVPVILGQMNFFLEFNVCFYRSRSLFEVRVKEGS